MSGDCSSLGNFLRIWKSNTCREDFLGCSVSSQYERCGHKCLILRNIRDQSGHTNVVGWFLLFVFYSPPNSHIITQRVILTYECWALVWLVSSKLFLFLISCCVHLLSLGFYHFLFCMFFFPSYSMSCVWLGGWSLVSSPHFLTLLLSSLDVSSYLFSQGSPAYAHPA